MQGSDGGNGNGHGHDAADPLPPAAERFADDVRAALDRQLTLFRDVVNMSEAAGAEHLNELKKLGDGITARLHQQDHEIAALKHRLDILEGRQAEAERPEP